MLRFIESLRIARLGYRDFSPVSVFVFALCLSPSPLSLELDVFFTVPADGSQQGAARRVDPGIPLGDHEPFPDTGLRHLQVADVDFSPCGGRPGPPAQL